MTESWNSSIYFIIRSEQLQTIVWWNNCQSQVRRELTEKILSIPNFKAEIEKCAWYNSLARYINPNVASSVTKSDASIHIKETIAGFYSYALWIPSGVNRANLQHQSYFSRKGQISDNMGQILSKIGQISPNMGQMLASMGQISANMGQISANMGQISANMGQISANMGQISANMGQISANFAVSGKLQEQLHGANELNMSIYLIMDTRHHLVVFLTWAMRYNMI